MSEFIAVFINGLGRTQFGFPVEHRSDLRVFVLDRWPGTGQVVVHEENILEFIPLDEGDSLAD